MPSYPSRPSSPTTLMHRLGQRPPGQIKQTLFNDTTRPVSGPVVMPAGGGPSKRVGGVPGAGGGQRPPVYGGDPIVDDDIFVKRYQAQQGIPQQQPDPRVQAQIAGMGRLSEQIDGIMSQPYDGPPIPLSPMQQSQRDLAMRNASVYDSMGRQPAVVPPVAVAPEDNQIQPFNTRFVGRMAETPRDLSGDNGVRTGELRPGVQLGYIPQYGTDGSIGQSRFVEGTQRGGMSIERNPRTGGIMLSGGGRPLTTDQQQGIYDKRAAMAQSYKDTRAARAYSRNLGLANAPAVAAMRDRRNDVEYERTKTRRRDAMLEQAQMAALQQQLKGMTPAQLNEFLGGMAGRPSGGVSLGDVTEYKKSKEKENRLGWQKYFAGPATMGMHRFHQLAR